jgi:hypothetical protein
MRTIGRTVPEQKSNIKIYLKYYRLKEITGFTWFRVGSKSEIL